MGLPGVRYFKRSEALFSGAASRGANAPPKALPHRRKNRALAMPTAPAKGRVSTICGVPPPKSATAPGFRLPVRPSMPLEGSFRTRSRASTISPRRFRAYSPSLPLWLAVVTVPPVTLARASHVRPQRRRHRATALPTAARHTASLSLSSARDSKAARLLTAWVRHAWPDPQGHGSVSLTRQPPSGGGRYTLELSSDLARLPRRVPGPPGFPSDP